MKNTFTSFLICCFTFFSFFLTAQGVLPTADIFKLQNCGTGEFLTAGNPPTMSATAPATDVTTDWQIVLNAQGNYNIDAQITSGSGIGILRATGSNVPLIGTNFAPPRNDADKSWTVTYDAVGDFYVFTHLNGNNRDMTIGANGDVTVNNSDGPNSQWKLITAILPLDFVSFKAQSVRAGTQLTWEVDNVVNNSHFEILKGNNPDKLQKIGSLKEIDGQNRYEFFDRESADQTTYYKLKQVDLDGRFSFSEIISVKSSLDIKPLVLYPNPVRQNEALTIESPQGYQIFNSEGMLLKSGTEKRIKVDLEKGIYFIKQNDNSDVKRIIVF
jgi:hypothetical protein